MGNGGVSPQEAIRDEVDARPRFRVHADGQSAPRRNWLALVPLLTGTFLGTVSNSIVNVPLRDIAREFDTPVASAVLVPVAFMLTFAVSMPITGWLGDRLGRRRVYCLALVGLGVTAIGAAVAPDLPVLVGFRVGQGLATGAVLPVVMGMIASLFGPAQRGRALGAWAAANGLGQAAGPTMGGVLADVASWRWVFVPIPPLALLALAATLRYVPPDRGRPIPLEWRGALTLTGGAALVLAAATAESQPDVPHYVAPLLAIAGVATLALFAILVRRTTDPFVSPLLIRTPSYLRSSLAVFAQMFCLGATLLGVALYLTQRSGASTAVAGTVVFAFPAAMAVLAPVSGLLTDRMGPRVVIRSGLLVLVAAQAWLAVALAGARSLAQIVLALVLTGVGVALVQTPAALGATRSDAGRAGAGLGLFNLIRFTGSAAGAAWVAIALGRASAFAVMFGVCAAAAGAGFVATFAGPDRPPRPDPRQLPG